MYTHLEIPEVPDYKPFPIYTGLFIVNEPLNVYTILLRFDNINTECILTLVPRYIKRPNKQFECRHKTRFFIFRGMSVEIITMTS